MPAEPRTKPARPAAADGGEAEGEGGGLKAAVLERMAQLGLSQAALAKKIDCSQGIMSCWLRGAWDGIT